MATIAGINNLYGFENLIGLTGDRRKAADLLHKSTARFSHRLADGQQLVNAKDGMSVRPTGIGVRVASPGCEMVFYLT